MCTYVSSAVKSRCSLIRSFYTVFIRVAERVMTDHWHIQTIMGGSDRLTSDHWQPDRRWKKYPEKKQFLLNWMCKMLLLKRSCAGSDLQVSKYNMHFFANDDFINGWWRTHVQMEPSEVRLTAPCMFWPAWRSNQPGSAVHVGQTKLGSPWARKPSIYLHI